MSDEINRDINDIPDPVYPIQKIYFGQEEEDGKKALLQFDVVPEDSGLAGIGTVGKGDPHSGEVYYESDFILTGDVKGTSEGSLFWDSNGRLIKGKCDFNANVQNLRNNPLTLLAPLNSTYDTTTAKTSTDPTQVTTNEGIMKNNSIQNEEELQKIDASRHTDPNTGKYIFFNDNDYEADSGYYGNILGYDKDSHDITLGDPAKIEIIGLNANEIKRGVTYFGVTGTFSGELGELETTSYIDNDNIILPQEGIDGWKKVTTKQVKIKASDGDAPYTYYIGEIKP